MIATGQRNSSGQCVKQPEPRARRRFSGGRDTRAPSFVSRTVRQDDWAQCPELLRLSVKSSRTSVTPDKTHQLDHGAGEGIFFAAREPNGWTGIGEGME